MGKITWEKISKNQTKQAVFVVDNYEDALLELFLIRNPKYKFGGDYQADFEQFKTIQPEGEWFYFPWDKTAIHYLPEKEYLELRTTRNKYLIKLEEQEKFYNCTVGIAGLSVGSHAALTLAMMGGSKHLKLADPDEVSVSNLNRLRYGASVLGKNKAAVAGQMVAEINPYAELDLFEQGINDQSLDDFLTGLDVLVEETDNLEMKIILREEAKKRKIPVIMATDNGDGVIADVERYDLNPDLQLFNGALGDFDLNKFKQFPPQDLPKLAGKIAGEELIVERMKYSLTEVGKTLYSWPQLGSAATFSGVVIAYLVRKIVLGEKLDSGKYDLNLDKFF